jgi:hypothetical protein
MRLVTGAGTCISIRRRLNLLRDVRLERSETVFVDDVGYSASGRAPLQAAVDGLNHVLIISIKSIGYWSKRVSLARALGAGPPNTFPGWRKAALDRQDRSTARREQA